MSERALKVYIFLYVAVVTGAVVAAGDWGCFIGSVAGVDRCKEFHLWWSCLFVFDDFLLLRVVCVVRRLRASNAPPL